MSRYRRAPIPGGTYFFTLNTYRRQVLLTQAEVLTALRSAHRVVRATRPFRGEAMVVLPDHPVWSLPSGDADYSTRLSLLKRHVSQTVRHLLLASQSASRHKRRELALWQRRFWEHQIRDAGDFARHVDYVHCNPVKHGLVAEGCSKWFPAILSSARTFALRVPSDHPSRDCPCLRLVVTFILQEDVTGTPTGDFHPISSCPCRAYTSGCSRRPRLRSAPARPRLNLGVQPLEVMTTDDKESDRPHRIATRAREIAAFLAERQRQYAERAQDFGYSKEVFDTVVTSFEGATDHPAFSATERSLGKFQEFLRVREAQVDALGFDVSSASFAVASTSTSTVSVISSIDVNAWVRNVEPPPPPPHWSRDRVEQYARKLETLDPELGKVARSIWQAFYGGADSAERTALFLMRQLYDHFFAVLAPDDDVRRSHFFTDKQGAKPQQINRRERLQYAAYARAADKALGESLGSEADQVLVLYEQLNRLHARGALEPRAVREVLTSMQAVIEQWADAIGL